MDRAHVRLASSTHDRFEASREVAERARRLIPRGVSSAMRAEQRPVPLQLTEARGSRLWDVDGNEYVDYGLGFGAAFLGHAPDSVVEAVRAAAGRGFAAGAPHAGEQELAQLVIDCVPGAEMAAPMTTGSEAVHAALRLARAATGRQRVVKFAGHYHGWVDPVFVSGPGSPPIFEPAIGGEPATAGVVTNDAVIVCPYDDIHSLESVLGDESVAAVLMEPIPCNFGTFEPAPDYLTSVRRLCDATGTLLVFDEVITGFRLALGGAQERYGVIPDLDVLSKAIGSGLPIAALVGREGVMRTAAGPVKLVGTYNGTPVPVAAACASVGEMKARAAELYPAVEALSGELALGLRKLAERHEVPLVVQQVGAVLQLLWGTPSPARSYEEVSSTDREAIAQMSELLVSEGVNALERGLWFVSAAHSVEDVDLTLAAVDRALARMPQVPRGAPRHRLPARGC
jgi:glutamate-1-semialdehyde 2,1-aminomutase